MTGRGLVAALLADTGDEEWLGRVPGRLDAFLAALPVPVRAAVTTVDAYAFLDIWRRLARLAPEASWTLRGTAHAEVGDR
ncbi:hypothetical protein [Streptomyces sp. NPDC001137]|uniref:hypothetical protein n=1 Tax=Streptomyces sp. NPDC001137 TaxID=3154378 RepID=UPI00331B57FD